MPTRALALALCLGAVACAAPPLARFEKALAAQDSATAALGAWCAKARLADPPRIVALPVLGGDHAEPADLRQALAIEGDEPVRLRHVRLACGGVVMSEAANWYVPARMTAEMNAALNSTNRPFGAVAAPLGFRRERLASLRGALPGCPPRTVLSHRARLILPDGRPLALLLECYQGEALIPRGQ